MPRPACWQPESPLLDKAVQATDHSQNKRARKDQSDPSFHFTKRKSSLRLLLETTSTPHNPSAILINYFVLGRRRKHICDCRRTKGLRLVQSPRLNKDGHLITGYYDLHKTAPHSALPVIIAVIKTPAFYLLSFAQHAACF